MIVLVDVSGDRRLVKRAKAVILISNRAEVSMHDSSILNVSTS